MALGGIITKAHPAFMGFLVFISLIEMIITAILVASYNRDNNYPSSGIKGSVRFTLFTSLWTIFFGAFYVAAFLFAKTSIIASIASHTIWAGLTWVFWLGAAAAVTNYLGGGLSCGNFNGPHCNQLNATEAFAWIMWILFTVFLGLLVFLGVRSSKNGNGYTGSLAA